MGAKSFQKIRKYSLAEQRFVLAKQYPEAKCHIKNGILYWQGAIRPTVLSNEYNIKLSYKMNYRPRVVLYGDNIKEIDNPEFPHNFKINKERKEVDLCLHYKKEFGSDCLIADTIIPWTVEWLYHYEIWIATGVWNGGGIHPGC